MELILEKMWLINNMSFPIVDRDCEKLIKDEYKDVMLVWHRVLYHNHIYKWVHSQPNSDKCNIIRMRLLYDWYGVNLRNRNNAVYFYIVENVTPNYDAFMGSFRYEITNKLGYDHKYKRMYKRDLI